jgi:hypothetical protein
LLRQVPRSASFLARARGKKSLHDAVFQRMEGDGDEAPTGLQATLGRAQAARQLAEFVVHLDAQRLEGARCRVTAVLLTPPEHAGNEIG